MKVKMGPLRRSFSIGYNMKTDYTFQIDEDGIYLVEEDVNGKVFHGPFNIKTFVKEAEQGRLRFQKAYNVQSISIEVEPIADEYKGADQD